MAISLCVLATFIDPTLKLQEIQDKTDPSFTGKSAGATKKLKIRSHPNENVQK